MAFKVLVHISCAFAIVCSSNSNAVVVNNLNGIDYEWLELSATQGFSRNQIETLLVDSNSTLYGYQYASRGQIQDLLLSYTAWDGLNGYYGAASVINGVSNLLADFGVTRQYSYGATYSTQTVDGYDVEYATFDQAFGMFGNADECCGIGFTCITNVLVKYDGSANATMGLQTAWHGYDSTYLSPVLRDSSATGSYYGSYLVRTTVVPVPAASWLFGFGFVSLLRIARKSN